MSYSATTANNEHITLLFAGDISFSGPIKYYVEHKYNTYNDCFNDVARYIREADISVGNLESPFVDKDVYRHMYKGKKSIILDASPEAAPALSFAGFDAVTLANNHFNDFGSEGANFSAEVLKKTGIKYFGISFGKYDSSQEPLILEMNGIKIGFLGYCDIVSKNKNCTEMRMLFNSGPAIYRDDIATRDVSKLKANVDIIAVYIHYGQELYLEPLPYQLHINKHLMSLGVQIIIGAHPHVLQPHYIKDNKLIAYSMGNFIFHPKETMRGSDPRVYGRLGVESNKFLRESFEHYVLERSEDLKATQMLKVTISRYILFKGNIS
ncbi:hypothetical protein OS493_028266 [Desmophyllum pertusum]|uniref:Capsule synthesis protein CapA domain-containing protein n=1 Tax=Desmophyllum pertusum TaxID=174260 RepID=A0A9W9YKQ4_9CNID|nr:hypothetical protein OS493_028266 [Desmophyllum pertusum]